MRYCDKKTYQHDNKRLTEPYTVEVEFRGCHVVENCSDLYTFQEEIKELPSKVEIDIIKSLLYFYSVV